MARSYANIVTAIWRPESPFRRERAEVQRAYLMLVTQPDVSAAGTLALTVKRWSALAGDTSVEDLHRVLVSLSDARYIVIDWETEELLIRSFVRHDNGYNNSKRRPAILDAARATRSPLLRRALAAEFGRLGLPTAGILGPEEPDPGQRRPMEGLSIGHPEPARDDPDGSATDSPSSQVEGLSDGHGDSPGVVVTDLDHRSHNPQPTTPTPVAPPLASDPSAVATREGEGVTSRTEDGTSSSFGLAFQAPPVASSGPAPHVTTPSSGYHDEELLIDQVLAIRPEWSARSVIRTLRDPDVACRPWPVVAAAMLAVAADRTTGAPGRLRADGPWWSAAAASAIPARSPTVVEPPCGECGPNRLVETDDGKAARCPRCHPLRPGAAA